MTTKGIQRQAWQVDFTDGEGHRCHRQFRSKQRAAAFETAIAASNDKTQLDRGQAAYSFIAPMQNLRTKAGQWAIINALLDDYPAILPTALPVIVHVTAECAPKAQVCDVDNLLKPVLDALAGHAYVNDTQVIECLARKTANGAASCLIIKVWVLPLFGWI